MTPKKSAITEADLLTTQKLTHPGEGFTREERYNCLFCSDSSFHLYVNRDKGLYHCFKCGSGGRLIQDKKDNTVDYRKLTEVVKGIRKDILGSTVVVDRVIKSLPHNLRIVGQPAKTWRTSEELSQAHAYLCSRGLDNEIMGDFDIRVSLEKTGPHRECIIFPNPGVDPEEYFVCRRYTDMQPKYVNAPWPKNGFLYSPPLGLDYNETLVICEGIFDVIRVYEYCENVAGLLGKKATYEQLQVLKNFKNIVIYLDPDAFTHALRLQLELKTLGVPKVTVVQNIDGKDPGDSTLHRIGEVLGAHL